MNAGRRRRRVDGRDACRPVVAFGYLGQTYLYEGTVAEVTDFKVTEVFTPHTRAQINFIPRLVDDVSDTLVESLQTPGRQVVVYGESGSGKSTLLHKKL